MMRSSTWSSPPAAWKAALSRTWTAISENNFSLVAAGVAFYGFLAFVPLLAAITLVYGLFADAATVSHAIPTLLRLMPPEAATVVTDQLTSVVASSTSTKGWGLALAFGFSIFGAMRAASAIIMAINIANGVQESRSFVRLNLLTIGLTIGLVLAVISCVSALSMIALLESQLLDWPEALTQILKIGPPSIAVLTTIIVVGATYKFAPARSHQENRWFTPGSLLATIGGISALGLFSVYLAKSGGYQATYGALGAIVALLMWFWISALCLCIGASVDVELERQAADKDKRTDGRA
jgi:membrane protein